MGDKHRQTLFFMLAIVFTGSTGHKDDGLPSFASVSTKIRAMENDTVVLPCYVDNLGDGRVQWWKGDVLLADSHGSTSIVDRVKMGQNHGLEVSAVIVDDHGEYECRVERQLPWEPLVQKHTIEVLYNPTVSLSPPGPIMNVTMGEEVVMYCEANAYPTPTITWSHQANLPEDSISLISFSSSKLSFKASSRTFSGLYTCTANNGVGSPVSATVRLIILHPPEVSVEREWVHASPGVRAELTFIVIAEPQAKVAWSKGNHPISTSQRISRKVIGNRHSLLFQKVTPQDLTTYSCTATNALGSDQRTILLTGVAREAVIKGDVLSPVEDSYTLMWEVESYTAIINFKLEFRKINPKQPGNWTVLVIPADGASALVHSKRYTLRGLSRASTYEAVVRSRNEYGWSPPSEIFLFSTKGDKQTTVSFSENVLENDSEVEEDTLKSDVVWSQAEESTILPLARNGSSCLHISYIFLIFFNISNFTI